MNVPSLFAHVSGSYLLKSLCQTHQGIQPRHSANMKVELQGKLLPSLQLSLLLTELRPWTKCLREQKGTQL